MPSLSPQERAQLQALGPALDKGLDPSFAMSIVQNVMQTQQARMQQHQATIQSGMDSLTQFAQQNPSSTAAQAYAGAVSQVGGLKDPGTQKLSNFASSLYPTAGQPSPIYAQSAAATTAPVDLATDLPAIDADIQGLVGTTNQVTGQPYTLHDVMMHVMQLYRAQGVDQATLDQISTFVQQRWVAYGGAP
jgi:hypothetical protein